MKQSKMTKAMALMLSMTMITSVFVGNTLSRYVTSVSSTDSARVAVWGINGDEVTMELFNTQYDLGGKLIAKSNVDGEKIIAPGTGGSSAFSIINFESDTIPPEVAYQVSINLDDSEVDEKIINNTSIQWKLDNNVWGTFEQLKSALLTLSGDSSGTAIYEPGEFAESFNDGVEHKIYWQWAIDGNNETDTQMGNDALTSDIGVKITVSITAQQTDDLITNENLLDGANQIVNLNDVQPLTFRSKSDIENFQRVEVNGNTVDPSSYTTESGSTIVKLNKEYLETLSVGTYIINIVSTDMTASTRFTVKDGSMVHNGIIPEGGTYYVSVGESYVGEHLQKGIECFGDEETGEGYYCEEVYSEPEIILTSGDEFQEVQTGDIYVYGDYEYGYNMGVDGEMWCIDNDMNGWGVRYIGNDTNPGNMLTSINGKNIVDMSWTFYGHISLVNAPVIPDSVINMNQTFEDCYSLVEVPVIPSTVTHMFRTFSGCASLVSVPVIPNSVTDMMGTFNGCTNLTGEVEINANPTNYEYALIGTEKPITLTGSSDLLNEIAATATNGNVTVQEEMIPCNCNEYGCDMCPVN